MSGDVWVVRAGRKAVFTQEFLDSGCVAVNFDGFASEDLRETDEAALRSRASNGAERAYAGQLAAFAYRMDVGDLVLVPRLTNQNRDYLVARVEGDYVHVPEGLPAGRHRRPVSWLGRIPHEALSLAATNTLGAILTLFRPTAVEPELRNLLTRLEPLDDAPPAVPRDAPAPPAAPPAAPGPPVAVDVGPARAPAPPSGPTYAAADLDVSVDPQGRAQIVSSYPALLMQQVPRHVEPSRDWDGAPAIYVLTGTELQSSSTRTGSERTLTTTLIVRPWAYVGLSESLRNRLSSHRQAKEEWRRALLVRSHGVPFSSDDIRYLERRVHDLLVETGEVAMAQAVPHGNVAAQPRQPAMLDACADTVVAVLRLTGTLI